MSGPSTPDRQYPTSPAFSTARRVHTLPSKLNNTANTFANPHADDAIETLSTLPFARVVSFEPLPPRPGSSRSDSSSGSQQHEILPWTIPTERTLAAGPLRIYRVPNTGVSFLNSGPFLKPILQRTQCWCVDDGTKVILKSQGYYRIELPASTEEERRRIEEIKEVLSTLCRFEKTPCPFRQGYHDDFEQPVTPSRRQSIATERAKKWRLNGVWEPEDAERRAQFQEKNRRQSEQFQQGRSVSLRASMLERLSPSKRMSQLRSDSDSGPVQQAGSFSTTSFPQVTLRPAPKPQMVKAGRSAGIRSIAARRASEEGVQFAPKFALFDPLDSAAVEPSKQNAVNATTTKREDAIAPHIVIDSHDASPEDIYQNSRGSFETRSFQSSTDSFYSFDEEELSIEHEPLLLSPGAHSTYSHSSAGGITVPPTPRSIDLSWSPLLAETDSCEIVTPTIPDLSNDDTIDATVIVQTLRRRRASPIFDHVEQHTDITPKQSPIRQIRGPLSPRVIGGTVIRKTCDLLLGPSFSLVALMVRIAQRILNQSSSTSSRKHNVAPGAWVSDADEADEETEWEDALELDDFDHPISGCSSRVSLTNGSRDERRLSSMSSYSRKHDKISDEWSVD